jgi:hypothetical protein
MERGHRPRNPQVVTARDTVRGAMIADPSSLPSSPPAFLVAPAAERFEFFDRWFVEHFDLPSMVITAPADVLVGGTCSAFGMCVEGPSRCSSMRSVSPC